MALERDQVLHIAELVKLSLSQEEVALYRQQLAEILDAMAKLNELNTDHIAPMAHVTGQRNVFREDRVREWFSPTDALANAPDASDGFVRVKPVLEK
jgi:aspartyl-tRNA(Asn)/glutamyl-tRNA(Gln) amidotransferase subunit C